VSRGAVGFVLVTVVLDVLALGLVIPVLPKLVERFAGSVRDAALVFGIFGTAWALMQLISSPIMGALSDRFGRRPVLLLSCLGLGLDYILMALAPDLAWLFVGRVISGITAATFSTAAAYIADVTPPEERAASFGLIGAAFGVGFVLGPAIGGLLGSADPRLPFWVAAAFSLANTAYGYFVLPESLPPDRRSSFSWRKANPIGSLHLLGRSRELMRIATAIFLYNVSHAVFPAVFVLHAGYRFGWGEGMVGAALAIFGLCSGIVQGVLIRPVVDRLGERRSLLAGMGAGIAGLALMGLAPTTHLFWLAMVMVCLWGFIGPAAQALMSRLVLPSEQGQLQGATASMMAIASLIAPSLFTQTFAWGIAPGHAPYLAGAPYWLAAVLLAIALVIARRSKGRADGTTDIARNDGKIADT